MRVLLRFVILLYQRLISPLLPAACRFSPSCSQYAREAIELHGTCKGSWLATKRIARCHPFGECGHDPVPTAKPDM